MTSVASMCLSAPALGLVAVTAWLTTSTMHDAPLAASYMDVAAGAGGNQYKGRSSHRTTGPLISLLCSMTMMSAHSELN